MISSFFCFIVLVGCGTLQPVPKSTPQDTTTEEITKVKVYNPETGQYEEVSVVQQPMDTIEFEIIETDIDPPIDDQTPPAIAENGYFEDLRSAYNVSLLLPFVSNSPPSDGMQINRKSLIAIQFYAGAQLALEQLSTEDINIKLSVFDTNADAGQVKSILDRGEVLNSDLIIGPYRNSSVKIATDFAKQYRKPVVSPFTPHENITQDNPYFIQMNPGLKSHMRSILRHIKSQYDSDQITIVALDNSTELQRLQKFQEVHRQMEGSLDVDPLKELVITREISQEETLPIDTSLFVDGRKAIYVFPSWSSERQVYEFLRKINLAKGAQDRVIVYGMPQWMNLEYYDYYERLNVHVTSAVFKDETDRRVNKFKSEFFSKFGDIPDDNAYLGYDTMLFFGRKLGKKGVNFYRILDQLEENMMTGSFNFEREVRNGISDESSLDKFDQYENANLNILQFKNYKFQRAN